MNTQKMEKMMTKPITLHPEHGLNPTLEQCSVCGHDTGSIVLLGNRIKGQAPHRTAFQDSVCDLCKEHMRIGVILIEAKDGQSGPNPIRTGRQWVVKEEAIERMFDEPSVEAIKKSRVAFIEEQAVKALGLDEIEPTMGHVDLGKGRTT